jgi:hypothetical protein
MKPSIEYLNARRAIKPASGGTNYRARERARYAPDSEAAPFSQPHLCGAFVTMTEQQTIAPFVSLDEAVLRIHRKWERVVDAEHRTQTARIECGMELVALRARIEAGEAGAITWWSYYEQKFTRSRADAEKVMAIASAANPQQAHEAAKARNAEINRAYRQRQQQPSRSREREPEPGPEPEILPPEPSPQEIEDRIINLFKQLHRQAQVRCATKLRKIIQGRA